MGFVARACDDNGHPSVIRVLELAGFETLRARFLPVSETVDLESLAQFFGCKEAELRSRMQLPIEVQGSLPNTFISHFGSPVRRLMREPALRRVSPASLRVSPHHRALSALRPLRYCPESGELLTSDCPNPACGKPLGWNYAQGIPFCEHCLDDDFCPTTDLRDLELPRLVGDELALYRSATGLLTGHPDAMRALPPAFASWHGWEVFDMIVMLGNHLCRRFPDRFKLRGAACFALPDWHQNLMSSARAVLNWPDGFGDLVKILNDAAGTRTGHYGRHKELGPLADFGDNYGALPKVKAAIELAIAGHYETVRGSAPERSYQAPPERADEMISYREALTKYDVTTIFLTSLAKNKDIEVIQTGDEKFAPTYYNERQLVELLEARREVLLIDRLVAITGLPMFAIEGLVGSGHIHLAAGALARFRDPSVHKSEIERFGSRIEANASAAGFQDGKPLMRTVLDAGGAGGGLLVRLVQLCLDGRIEYWLSERRGGFISRVVLSAKAVGLVETMVDEVAPAPTPTKMTRRDVTMYLDMPTEDIVAFVKAGVLQAEYKVNGESVRRFNESYVTTSTVARRLNISVQGVKRIMDGRGVQPAHSVDPPGRSTTFAWRRADVIPIIERSVHAPRHREGVGSSTQQPFDEHSADDDTIPSDRRSSKTSKPKGAAFDE
ncbi:hypothetical protein NLM33_25155 [Bradyrhizobium sp. CCGUVB1N3]|uniref:hypothetical protein n=1 Tax=Bradyrhizobium sp. CCGUVB1N3 TaxID=2949629 RepID=UPI0020B20CAE|nr:hypothetical protein [Bradyrhizobium sp. CCGUVB1N3]MCP3471825.1 hypothetical protein [Bradyrhizobium sp. CCGUVB1N3]MCP3473607.1 hypothetical protein [Bradyrhizobium sp. CCGUVB1N3]